MATKPDDAPALRRRANAGPVVRLAATPLILAMAVSLTVGCSREPETKATSPYRGAILITIDTARADHYSAYRYGKTTSPRFDALAQKGALFERAIVPIPRTTQSLASLMTGLEPFQHGVRRLDQTLDEKFTTLAERLGDAGYRTGAIVEIPFLTARGGLVDGQGLEQGFAPRFFDDVGSEKRAEQVTDAALDWLERNLARDPGLKFFLWLHYRDPHAPYWPPQPFKNRFDAGYREPYDGPLPEYFHYWPVDEKFAMVVPPGKTKVELQRGKELLKFGKSELLTPRFIERATALYDGEIAYTDDQIGRLVDGVSRLGLGEHTITVITADHGESLGEHDFYFDHGEFLYDTCLHVPLVFDVPGFTPVRVPDLVGTIDIAPTLLELLGAQPFDSSSGHSLVPLLRGEAVPPRDYLAESGEPLFPEGNPRFEGTETAKLVDPQQRLRGWSSRDRVKVVYDPVTKKVTAYDLEKDPGEKVDRSTDAEVARRLEATKRVLESVSRISNQKLPRADYEKLKQLAENGYISGDILIGLEVEDDPPR